MDLKDWCPDFYGVGWRVLQALPGVFRDHPKIVLLSLPSHTCQHTWKGITLVLRPQEETHVSVESTRKTMPWSSKPRPALPSLLPCSVDRSGHRDLPPGEVQEPGLLSAVSMHAYALSACVLCSSSPHVCLLLRETQSNPLPMLTPPQPRDGATEVSKSWFGKAP